MPSFIAMPSSLESPNPQKSSLLSLPAVQSLEGLGDRALTIRSVMKDDIDNQECNKRRPVCTAAAVAMIFARFLIF